MTKNNNRKKKIGQITIQKVGDKFAICISGSPLKIESVMEKAERFANKLRKKHGRRLKKKSK